MNPNRGWSKVRTTLMVLPLVIAGVSYYFLFSNYPVNKGDTEKTSPIKERNLVKGSGGILPQNLISVASLSKPLPKGSSASQPPDPRVTAFAERLREVLDNLAAGKTVTPQKTLRPIPTAANYDPGLIPPVPQLSPEQNIALSKLRWRSGKHLEWRARSQNKTLYYLEGRNLEPATEAAEAGFTVEETTALNFLRQNRDLLLLNDPDQELSLFAETYDELGYTQLHYLQTYEGLLVWPAALTVQLNKVGNVHLMTGAYVPTPDHVILTPELELIGALQMALTHVGATPDADVDDKSLIVYAPGDTAARLAYKFGIHKTLLEHWLVVVAADNGNILTAYNTVCTAATVGSGVGLFGQTRTLNLWSENDLFYMVDTSKPMFDAGQSDPPFFDTTFGGITIFDANNFDPDTGQNFQASLVSSTSATSGFLPDTVSAAFNFSRVYDYYLDRHGRDSFDDQGSSIIGIINFDMDNAFWSGDFMGLGNIQPFAGALDVVAHELTHGVIQHSADLLYINQSGALNEAFADIFGESTEAFYNAGTPDWLLGTELSAPIRDMKNPESFGQPSKMSEYNHTAFDNGGVHINSGIINHAFYLLAEGLSDAIGIFDAESIFYRALTTKLQLNSQFIECRLACVQSAEELFGVGSLQAIKTAEAFNAVEIFDQAGTPEPTPIPEVSGDDSTLFTFVNPDDGLTYLGRRDLALGDPDNGVFLSFTPMAPDKRPTIFGDGSFAIFVTALNDLIFIDTLVGIEIPLGFPGLTSSIGSSADGSVFGLVLLDPDGQPENRIFVGSIDDEDVTIETYDLIAPVLDGGGLATVLYADDLDFSPDGRFLYYDALNKIAFVDGSSIETWSIYVIDRQTGDTYTIVPPIPGFNIANPSLGQTHSNLITFEADDIFTTDTSVIAADLNSGDFNILATLDSSLGLAYPGYNGDDSALIYTEHLVSIPVLQRLPLADDGISSAGSPTDWLIGANIGVIYRQGLFEGLPLLNVVVSDVIASEEGNDNAILTVSRIGSTQSDLSFSFVITGTASNGLDYQEISLSATIPAGLKEIPITIVPINDSIVEQDETVTLTLSTANHYIIGGFFSGTVILLDDDSDRPPFSLADANLEAALRDWIGKPVEPITVTDLASLTFLDANAWGITDLTGLEYAVNLTLLILYGNQISDISPLADLTNLNVIFLFDNQISDISPLAGLTNLTELDLGLNQIIDLSPLSGLTNLNNLWIDQNQIISISPLAGLTNLTILSLWSNQITDISPLAGLTNLVDLSLENNFLDITPGSAALGIIAGLQAQGTSVTFEPQNTVGLATLMVPLFSGWNWVSFNLTLEDASIGAVLQGYALSDNDVIKGQEGSATYFGGQWFPSSQTFEIKTGLLYKILKQSSGDESFEVTGQPADPSVSIDLVSGWNWIGHNLQEPAKVEVLAHSGSFLDNDTIKGQEGSATFFGGQWFPSSETFRMKPGKGYLLNTANPGQLTFDNVVLESQGARH